MFVWVFWSFNTVIVFLKTSATVGLIFSSRRNCRLASISSSTKKRFPDFLDAVRFVG